MADFDFKQEVVSNEEELDALFERVQKASDEFKKLNQEQVDKIFFEASFAVSNERIPLAIEAVNETNIGVVEDKVIKNMFGSEYVYNKYKNMKTVGLIEMDEVNGFGVCAEPLGILAGVIPTTNPTSTAIFKSLIALKTRNCIIFSPHPRAARCTIHAVQVIRDAAIKAGAPENCIAWITHPSVALSASLMKHPKTSCILATGGPAMVFAAYSSGNPSIGVGPGDVPCLIDDTCDYKAAVSQIIASKTFDNGVICASEQAIVCSSKAVYDKVRAELAYRGCYMLSAAETKLVGDLVLPVNPKTNARALNPSIVGRPAREIAERAGVKVPEGHICKIIVGEFKGVDHETPMSCEKLSPVLGITHTNTFEEAVEVSRQMVKMAGQGHTAAIHTHFSRADRIKYFTDNVNAGRIVVNCPSTFGGIGDLYNFRLDPTMTIGCGSYGKNSVSENVGPKHLLNYKSVAITRPNTLWYKGPAMLFFNCGSLAVGLQELIDMKFKRCFIVIDKALNDLGFAKPVSEPLAAAGMAVDLFTGVLPDPTLECSHECLGMVKAFAPDLIIAIGGGSAMDLMKMVRLMYEAPHTDFVGLAQRFMDIRKRIYTYPAILPKTLKDRAHTYSVCISTTSGTGSEVSPFAVITDEKEGVKYPLADYELTPQMAIVDGNMALSQPKFLVSWCGVDVLTHAMESYVSVLATEYTKPLSLRACKLIFTHLAKSYKECDKTAREAVHNAATLAAIAFSNAFLGICHSCAHKLGQKYHIPHGYANAIMLPEIVRFNATDAPTKMGVFPQYLYPCAVQRYAEIADFCGLTKAGVHNTDAEKVQALLEAIYRLYDEVELKPYIRDTRNAPSKEQYEKDLDYLAYQAFDDQCTAANPRYPLIEELKVVFRNVYEPGAEAAKK